MLDTRLEEGTEAAPPAPEALLAEQVFLQEVNTHLRRNYLALLLHGVFGMTGFRLLQAPTFLPAYLYMLSGSPVVVGWVLAAQFVGSTFASLPGGNLISHRKKVVPVFMWVGGAMRVMVLGISLSGFFLPEKTALWSIAICLLLFGAFNGMQAVAFQFTVSKLIPGAIRGRLMGLRNFFAGIVAAAVAYMGGGYFIEHHVMGNGYAATFFLAFILTTIGLLGLKQIREPEPPNIRPPAPLLERLKELPRQSRTPGFRRFIAGNTLASLAVAAVPFYVLYAKQQMTLTGFDLGVLTVSFMLIQTVVTPVWGILGDRFGNSWTFAGSTAVWGVSLVLLLFAGNLFWLAVVFGGLGVGIGGLQIAGQNLMLEYGSRDDQPMMIALASMTSSAMFAIGPILAGMMVEATSYTAMFLIAIAVKAAAVWVIMGNVRRRKASAG
ncbi:MAG: MFS transporter [Alphaproteobacteria bacterium]|nr:MFS transporter [Alphaproteobacteria bacterium]